MKRWSVCVEMRFNHPTAEKGCVSEHIIFRGGSLVVSRWRGGPGWLEVWWAPPSVSCWYNSTRLSAATAALQCQTVQSCARVGLAPTSRQATRQETKEWGLPRSWGGGGAFTLESQQHFQRVRPDLGTRASKRGHCTPCATPRACTSCSCSTKRIHKRRLQHLGTNFKSSNKNAPPQNVHHFVLMKVHNFRLSWHEEKAQLLRVKWQGGYLKSIWGRVFEVAGILGVGKCPSWTDRSFWDSEPRKLWGTRPPKPRVGGCWSAERKTHLRKWLRGILLKTGNALSFPVMDEYF